MPLRQLTAAEATDGRTVRYIAASGESFNATVDSMSVRASAPATPGIATAGTGGTLGATLSTSYRMTAVINGVESQASTAATIVTGAGTTNTVTLTWSAVTGASSYRIYGRTSGTELLMGTVQAPTLTFIDTGAVTPSGALPAALAAGAATLRVSTTPGSLGSRLLGGILAATTMDQTNVYQHRW